MADFEIDGVAYKSGLLDGSVQTKLLKRLLPITTALIGRASLIAAAQERNDAERADLDASADAMPPDAVAALRKGMSDRMAEAVMPVSREIAALSDADEDFIVNACFAVTEWHDPSGRWYPVRDPDGTILHQRNRSVVVRATVTMRVIAENFSDMFAGFGVDIQRLVADAGGRK